MIVGVSGDKETIEKKGKIVMDENERSDILKHCKWVDEVIMPCPWVLTVDFLRKHNIHYVAHDAIPYTGEGQEDIYSEVKRLVSIYYKYNAINIGYVQGDLEDRGDLYLRHHPKDHQRLRHVRLEKFEKRLQQKRPRHLCLQGTEDKDQELVQRVQGLARERAHRI